MRIAALDLGSNSFHLLIVEGHNDGSFVPLSRDKELLRLGEVVAREGRLPEPTVDKLVATVRRFKALIDAAGVEHIRASATSAIRDAANRKAVVERIAAETGIAVQVLTGDEEAKLIFEAVRASVVVDPTTLCLDLGGGSLEIMVGGPAGMLHSASIGLGATKLSAELVEHDPPSMNDVRRLRKRLTDGLAPIAEEMVALHPTMAVGTSGTLCDLARMATARRQGAVPASVNHLVIGRDELLSLHEEIVTASAAERLRMPGLDSRRADVMPAGATLLLTAMELFGFSELTVSEWALREGIVLDAISQWTIPSKPQNDGRDMRRASVLSLARRCNWDEIHGRQVARLAIELFDQTRELHGMGPTDRELLEHAALLHDIGHHVARESHHKHTGYLIQHGRLRGFQPREIDALAALARYHRRGDPKPSHEPFASLDADVQRRVTGLAGLLRIADGLDFGHTGAVEEVLVSLVGGLVTVQAAGEGALELEIWGARRKRHLFEKAFGCQVDIVAAVSLPVG